jgi:hypothetical protein
MAMHGFERAVSEFRDFLVHGGCDHVIERLSGRPRRSIRPNLCGRECADPFQPIPVMPKSRRQAIPVPAHRRKQGAATRSGAASPARSLGRGVHSIRSQLGLCLLRARWSRPAPHFMPARSRRAGESSRIRPPPPSPASSFASRRSPMATMLSTLEQGYELGRPSTIRT